MTDMPDLPPSGAPVPKKLQTEPEHWLVRKSTIRWLWIWSVVVLAGLTALDAVIKKKSHFSAEDLFGFGSLWGFVACVALVFGSKALGVLLKRRDDFYDE